MSHRRRPRRIRRILGSPRWRKAILWIAVFLVSAAFVMVYVPAHASCTSGSHSEQQPE
jgi:hypothetical protein